MNTVKLIGLLLIPTLLAACSKTVQWEEEVPLNTGETIWVKRSMPWVYKGGFGNPFDMAMRPTGEQTIFFKYSGKEYSFTAKALVNWIAISPDRQPVLVGIPGAYGWHSLYENAFYCVVPYYVQFVPDETGKKWTWPEKIDSWLYNLPANLMVSTPRLNEGREERYATSDRNQRDKTYRLQSPYGRYIDPLYDANGDCGKKYDPSMKPTQTWSEK
jgi:hypothetical protein